MAKLNKFYRDIEAPIRPLVRLLRDNGWNTTCSCGHGMWVELDVNEFMDNLEVLRSFLLDHGHKEFTITAQLRVMNGWPVRGAAVYLGDYVPADQASAKELSAKISHFKEASERLNQENYRLRERLKAVTA